jgi:rhodanese-related sulfurtransferase
MKLANKTIEIIIILTISIAVGLIKNQIHTKGIPLNGQWDRSEGTVTAGSKQHNSVAEKLHEIKSPAEAKKLYDTGKYVFVDARPAEMFMEGRVKGAVSFPVNEFDIMIEDFIRKYPVNTSMILYCSGRECEDSHNLGNMLKEMGYSDIQVMIDGYPGWKEGGFPVEND